jgi:hypothetical protein
MHFKILLRAIFLILLFSGTVSACRVQRVAGNPEKALFGKSHHRRQTKIKELPSIRRARKKQEANQKKLDKEYQKYVEENRKHSLEIQTPEVKDRMVQNRKDANKRYKEKKKKREENFRKAGMKLK